MKKLIYTLIISLIMAFTVNNFACAADYSKKLTPEQKKSMCDSLKNARNSSQANNGSLGGGIIPDAVLSGILETTRRISNNTALVLVLGHALTCNATEANSKAVKILGITLFKYPNIPVWLCGAIIYFVGFLMTMSVTFYLVDIAFKLGFAVMMLPIGIALWPFPVTKDKLSVLISIILKNSAIFAFLALTVCYALNLIFEATGGMESLFSSIDENETDTITENFSLFSTNFLIIAFALNYGFQLIGATITDYVDKFFPDKAFGGGQAASPIHGSMTQAVDFAKKKAIAPLADYASDVAKTQAGRAVVGAGKLIGGKYNDKIKNFGQSAKNTKVGKAFSNATDKLKDTAVGRGATRVASGAKKVVSGIEKGYDKTIQALDNAQEKISAKKEHLNDKIDAKVAMEEDDIAVQRTTKKLVRGALKVPGRMASGLAKAPLKVAKTAVKATNVKGWVRATGGLMEKVGTKMQQNQKKQNQSHLFRDAAAQPSEEELLEQQRERQREMNWDD